MVCYPFISKEEYLEKHLNIISEEAYTIFSEDLDDGDLLNKKINTVFEKNNLIPHSDFTYDLMLRIRRNYEPDLMKKNEYADAITPYSKLFFLPSSVDASKCKEVVSSEALMLSSKMFCGVSNGSACTSKSYSPSYVLVAMGVPEEQIECSIRISWGANTDIEEAIEGVKALLSTALQFSR